jgi:hypothetical protein
MFDHAHYVPILRWKRGEWVALSQVRPEHCAHMTPLIELTPRAFEHRKPDSTKARKNVLRCTANDILEYWGSAPIFLERFPVEYMAKRDILTV